MYDRFQLSREPEFKTRLNSQKRRLRRSVPVRPRNENRFSKHFNLSESKLKMIVKKYSIPRL